MVEWERVESVNRRRVKMVGCKMVETVGLRRAELVTRPRVQVARPREVKPVRRWGVEGVRCFREGGSHEGGTRLAAGEAVQCAVAAVFQAFVLQAPLACFFLLDCARINRSWAVYTCAQRTNSNGQEPVATKQAEQCYFLSLSPITL